MRKEGSGDSIIILSPSGSNEVTSLLLVSHYSGQLSQYNYVKLSAVCIRFSIVDNTKKLL